MRCSLVWLPVLLGVLFTLSAQTPPRMFSPWYAESLRDTLKLEESDVGALEGKLAANPDDSVARLKLMAYHQRGDRAALPEDRAKRAQHALWLIEHHPDSELLHSPVSRFAKGELPTADYHRAVALWDAAARRRPADAAVQWNAAAFFEDLDPALRLHYLETTAVADPNHPFAIRPLAHLYALTILEQGPLAQRAQAGLDASKNVWVLGNAAYMFQSQYNRSIQLGAPSPRAATLAERYYLRAKAIDPSLNRQAILPQLPPRPAAVPPQASPVWVEAAVAKLPRASVQEFPQLPPVIAGVLRQRGCTVPQPSTTGPRRNVVRGQFFAKGDAGWAVLCSAGNTTALLAFRNQSDTSPETVATTNDRSYVSGPDAGPPVYSREITAVGRDFILGHYRAYGGPKPPPLDHQGIDDAFLEKASVTWYFYEGKWLRLQGAD